MAEEKSKIKCEESSYSLLEKAVVGVGSIVLVLGGCAPAIKYFRKKVRNYFGRGRVKGFIEPIPIETYGINQFVRTTPELEALVAEAKSAPTTS